MGGFISIIFGALIGYFIIKKQMEKRLYSILVKMGVFAPEQLQLVMDYYTNYNRVVKDAKKKQYDEMMKLECAYHLRNEDKSKKL